MISKKNIALFYILGIAFAFLNAWAILEKGNYFISLIPIVLLIVYAAIFRLDKLMLAVAFFTPLSLNITDVPGIHLGQIGIGVALPTEPIMFGILLIFILRMAYEGMSKEVFWHPVTMAINFSLLWMLVTSITSSMPFVSFKYLIERSWGVATFYFLGIYLFKVRKNILSFSWMYIIGFTCVIIYTIIRHWQYGFTEKPAHFVVNPFYNDHTAYGALLAMFIPILIGLCFIKGNSKSGMYAARILTFVFLIAVALSYSRAAWVSLVAALGMYILIMLRLKLRTLFIMVCIAVVGILVFQKELILKLEKNNKEVSQDIGSEIQSISNISSDASNRERINRWSCAVRMFKDKPFLGYGPGTYMFQYAPYQLSYQKTIISTNLGTGGNAHSEYLGPMAEQGILGFVAFFSIVVAVFVLFFKLYYTIKERDLRIIVLSVFLGLVTYFVHGAMNNFLDTDKAAVPFWGFIAVLVAIDLQYGKGGSELGKEEATTSVSGTPAA